MQDEMVEAQNSKWKYALAYTVIFGALIILLLAETAVLSFFRAPLWMYWILIGAQTVVIILGAWRATTRNFRVVSPSRTDEEGKVVTW